MLDILDRQGIPLLVCLTHADKLYANECLRNHGKDCPDDTARRIIGRELEVCSYILYIYTTSYLWCHYRESN